MLFVLCRKNTFLKKKKKVPSPLDFRRKRDIDPVGKKNLLVARPSPCHLYLIYIPPPQFRAREGPLHSDPSRAMHSSWVCFYIYIYINVFIYFWLRWVFVAARGLSLVGGQWGLLVMVRWLLLLRSTGSRCADYSSCGTWAQ